MGKECGSWPCQGWDGMGWRLCLRNRDDFCWPDSLATSSQPLPLREAETPSFYLSHGLK